MTNKEAIKDLREKICNKKCVGCENCDGDCAISLVIEALDIVKCKDCSFATDWDDGQGYFKYKCNNEYGMNGCLQTEDSYCSGGRRK